MEFIAQKFSTHLYIIYVCGSAAPENFVWIYGGSSCKKCIQGVHHKWTVCSNGSADQAHRPRLLSDKQRGKRYSDWA